MSKLVTFHVLILVLVASGLTTGCGVPEMIGGGIALHRASRDDGDRRSNSRGEPKQFIRAENDVRKGGSELAEYWEDGFVGDQSEPYYRAYTDVYANPNATVSVMKRLANKGLVKESEIKRLDLHDQRNALRWLIKQYKRAASEECVDAANTAQGALDNGYNEDGQSVAAIAYRKLLDIIQSIPDEPVVETLHFKRILALANKQQVATTQRR